MVSRIILSVIVGVIVWALAYILGVAIGIFVPVLGNFLISVAWLLALVAGLWYFLTGRNVIS